MKKILLSQGLGMLLAGTLLLPVPSYAKAGENHARPAVTGTAIIPASGAAITDSHIMDSFIHGINLATDSSIRSIVIPTIEIDPHVIMKGLKFSSFMENMKKKKETGSTLQKPEKVKKLHLCSLGSDSAKLTWEKAKNAQYYLIYKKAGKSGKYKKIGRTKKNSYISKNLSFGTVYQYRVVPCKKKHGKKLKGPATQIRLYNKNIVARNHQKYTYKEMKEDITLLCQKYYGLVKSTIVGKSEDNRDIYDIYIGKKNAKKTLLVVSTLHAREYMCSLLSMSQIEYYLKNYYGTVEGEKVESIMNDVAIHYIPMANPDGVSISQEGFAAIQNPELKADLQRMGGDTLIWKANGRGVDLNRNFAYKHSEFGTRGYAGYSGPSAMSEKEAQAIAGLVNRLTENGSLQGVVNYHAMGSIIFGDCKKKGDIKKVTKKMYKTACTVTGYASADGYGSSDPNGSAGNFREYLMYKKEIPNITIEIGYQTCPGPISEFSSIWEHNASLVLKEAALFCN